MAFFKTNYYGRLYVIKLTFPDGLVVFKVGMTESDRSANRMMEVLRSWFMAYRFIPYTELKLDREAINPKALEKLAHKVLRDYRWSPDRKVDGGTEMFTGLNQEKLLHFLRHLEAHQDANAAHLLGKLLEESNDD